jgi:hypothetical protein
MPFLFDIATLARQGLLRKYQLSSILIWLFRVFIMNFTCLGQHACPQKCGNQLMLSSRPLLVCYAAILRVKASIPVGDAESAFQLQLCHTYHCGFLLTMFFLLIFLFHVCRSILGLVYCTTMLSTLWLGYAEILTQMISLTFCQSFRGKIF